jgi:hypothetical protein
MYNAPRPTGGAELKVCTMHRGRNRRVNEAFDKVNHCSSYRRWTTSFPAATDLRLFLSFISLPSYTFFLFFQFSFFSISLHTPSLTVFPQFIFFYLFLPFLNSRPFLSYSLSSIPLPILIPYSFLLAVVCGNNTKIKSVSKDTFRVGRCQYLHCLRLQLTSPAVFSGI